LDAANVSSGTLNGARIPDIDASKVTTGTLNAALIPNLNASKITAGTISKARLPVVDIQVIKGQPCSYAFQGIGHGTSWEIVSQTTSSPYGFYNEKRNDLVFNGIDNTIYGEYGGNSPPLKRYVIFDINGNNRVGLVEFSVPYSLTSDDRLKSDEEFITSSTETLCKLRPQIYNKWTRMDFSDSNVHSANTRESGLIAQEIFYDAPELRHLVNIPGDADSNSIYTNNVTSSSDPSIDPEYKDWGSSAASVNYVGLIPYLIAAIKEKNSEINDLRTRVVALERR